MLRNYEKLEFFIPKEQAIRTRNGKKIISMVPVIPSLIFVHASQKISSTLRKQSITICSLSSGKA